MKLRDQICLLLDEISCMMPYWFFSSSIKTAERFPRERCFVMFHERTTKFNNDKTREARIDGHAIIRGRSGPNCATLLTGNNCFYRSIVRNRVHTRDSLINKPISDFGVALHQKA